jgi:glycosyltransferase involved in cell wall biosynthesis
MAQTCSDFEVILINDGSTDGSDRKCVEWSEKDERIRYISRNNHGLGPTRNFGLCEAKCEYVTYLDSDDWWEPEYVERMLDTVRRFDADIVVCDINYIWIGDNGGKNCVLSELRLFENRVFNARMEPDLLNRIRVFAWGKVYRKAFLRKADIPQPAHAFEDIPVTPALAVLAERVCRVGKPLYCYRHNRSGSLANDPQRYRDILLSLRELRSVFEKRGLFQTYCEQLKKMSYSQIRFMFKKSGHDVALLKELLAFMKEYHPDWTDITECRFGIVGDEWTERAVCNLVFDERQIIFCKHISEFTPAMLSGIDYVVIDGLSVVSAEMDFALKEVILRRIFEACKEKNVIALFIISYPRGGSRADLSGIYVRLLSVVPEIKTVNVGEISADTPDGSDCWNAADALFRAVC